MIVIVLPDIPDEDQLLTQARKGDQDAVMRIYELYFPPIYQFIRLRVSDPAQAEDVASEVFVRLVEALRGRNAPRHSLRGWLFRVARSELSRHYGKANRLTTTALDEWLPAPPENEPELQFVRNLNLERARHAIRMLAAEQQEVLILRFGQALSLQETADIMDRSIGAIKSLQFRAVDNLRRILAEMREEGGFG
jgi:RNA polymerase sigma-70 factor, ECF subfamily